MEELYKILLDNASEIIAGFALIISIFSLLNSKKANDYIKVKDLKNINEEILINTKNIKDLVKELIDILEGRSNKDLKETKSLLKDIIERLDIKITLTNKNKAKEFKLLKEDIKPIYTLIEGHDMYIRKYANKEITTRELVDERLIIRKRLLEYGWSITEFEKYFK